jgi:hypothetical protein
VLCTLWIRVSDRVRGRRPAGQRHQPGIVRAGAHLCSPRSLDTEPFVPRGRTARSGGAVPVLHEHLQGSQDRVAVVPRPAVGSYRALVAPLEAAPGPQVERAC